MEQKLNKFKRKLQKNKATDGQLFQVHGLLEYGFPSNASAIAYDDKLSLLALGTSTGEVRLFGKAGVQLVAAHKKSVHIFQLLFIPNQGRVISQGVEGENSVISLFETNTRNGKDVLELVKSVPVESKKVTTCSLSPTAEFLLVGTEVGDVYKLNVQKFKEFEEDVIHLDVAMQNVPDDFKVSPGGVEAIELHPTEENLVLIGYSKGLLVLWDLVDNIPQGTFFTSCKALESVAWYKDSSRFLSAHEDGSYFIWSKDPEKQYNGPRQVLPFGEDEQSKKISKIQVLLSKSEDEYVVFAGGLPKDTYSTTNSVSVKQGSNQINFELSSKFIDFVVIPEAASGEGDENLDRPSALLILTEGELIAIDLQTEGADGKLPLWPTFNKPYLSSASPSDLTSLYVYEDCDQSFLDKLRAYGKEVSVDSSPREWPVTGGKVADQTSALSLLVTGHYDGAVRFYDVNNGRFELLYTLSLGNYFKSDDLEDEPEHEALGDVKLRKVGADFGVCVDDSRYAICKIYVCPKSQSVVIGGHSGQVVVFDIGDSESNTEAHELKIVASDVGFKWKGCHPLSPKEVEPNSFPVGFAVSTILQCEPPAPVTALVVNTHWGVLAVGTNHGFGAFDLKNRKVLLLKNTLVENDDATSGQKLSKSKSLKEGIRNSFRRIKPKKAAPADASPKPDAPASPAADAETKPADENKPADAPTDAGDVEPKVEAGATEEITADGDAPGPSTTSDEPAAKTDEEKLKEKEDAENHEAAAAAAASTAEEEGKGGDRVVAARSEQDKTLQSTVRYLAFADTFLRNSRDHSPSLWVGTHAGTIYAYLVEIPENRESEVTLALAKEIRLHHRAPVVFMSVLDHSGFPLPDPAAVSAGKQNSADMSGHHHLLVCSEEQVKLFTLPQLKGKYKEKLTAVEGVKVRKVSAIKHRQDDTTHNFLACMLNEGQVSVFSLPGLFCQYKDSMVASDNKVATLHTEFVSDSTAYSLASTNLIKHFGLAKDVNSPAVEVNLPEGSRPVEVVPEPEPVKEEEEVVANEEASPAADEDVTEPTAENNAGPSPDLQTVEEEAKQMIDEAEEQKDQEFQTRIKDELSPDNPEITSTTTTTYRAIESRTILSSDDGENVAKIITTTRDTTLALDGELVTQKTQQKEEFELSPTEENPDEENVPIDREGNADVDDESSDEMIASQAPNLESTPVRTATLTSEKSDADVPADESKLDDDQVTHHIGDELPAEEPTPEDGVTGVCYGGSSGNLYSPLAREEAEKEPFVITPTSVELAEQAYNEAILAQQLADEQAACPDLSSMDTETLNERAQAAAMAVEKAAAALAEAKEQAAAKQGVSGDCYGGSQGELYSPLSREQNEQNEEPQENETPNDSAASQENQSPLENGEAAAMNGDATDENAPADDNEISPDSAPVKQLDNTEEVTSEPMEA